jgi:tyrosinase
MSGYDVKLDQYDSVRQWAVLIYHYLHSRAMPLTTDEREYWPDEALETLRAWINQGFRKSESDPPVPHELLPVPVEPQIRPRIRKDIRSLTQTELDTYRMHLDEHLQPGNPDPAAPGQQFAAVHGDWCLHYQEAFLFWHRAYLMRFEQTIGCAVPYWNWLAEDASIDGSPDAGIPQAFKDLTYMHPHTGEQRPNPLRFAAARKGCSKGCQTSGASTADCLWVQRDPLLYTSGDERRDERKKKIAMTRIFQEQVVNALSWPSFSQPQGWPGYPWANITEFNPPQPDSLYPNRTDFDGLYEQPHDNYHGWVGPDMADNAYTAYDPLFWSYHANIDRVFEIWLRGHPAALYSSNTPLHPFYGPLAERFEFDDPRRFVYTSIGDLAKDSRALGYDYGVPVAPDFIGTHADRLLGGGAAAKPDDGGLYVLFNGVRCTFESYTIDVFLDQALATPADVDAGNPHYVGRFTRVGMGIADDKGRCIKQGVTRVLDATSNGHRLRLTRDSPATLSLLVTELKTGKLLTPDEYLAQPGFAAELVWGRAWPRSRGQQTQAASATPNAGHAAGHCCRNGIRPT